MNRTERLARLLASLPPYDQFREGDDERSRIAETPDEDPREERKT